MRTFAGACLALLAAAAIQAAPAPLPRPRPDATKAPRELVAAALASGRDARLSFVMEAGGRWRWGKCRATHCGSRPTGTAPWA